MGGVKDAGSGGDEGKQSSERGECVDAALKCGSGGLCGGAGAGGARGRMQGRHFYREQGAVAEGADEAVRAVALPLSRGPNPSRMTATGPPSRNRTEVSVASDGPFH